MSNVSVTPASFADIRRVAGIESAVFSDPWSEDFFQTLPGDPRVFFACARLGSRVPDASTPDDSVRGYVVAVFAADEAEIANLAVSGDARGQGVGAALLDAVLRESEKRGANTVYLEVRESNAAARGLYGSRGFLAVGRRKGYYRRPSEDALILSRAVIHASHSGS